MANFAVASSAGKQKVETRGAREKKESRIQKFEVEIQKKFVACGLVGRNSAVVLWVREIVFGVDLGVKCRFFVRRE